MQHSRLQVISIDCHAQPHFQGLFSSLPLGLLELLPLCEISGTVFMHGGLIGVQCYLTH